MIFLLITITVLLMTLLGIAISIHMKISETNTMIDGDIFSLIIKIKDKTNELLTGLKTINTNEQVIEEMDKVIDKNVAKITALEFLAKSKKTNPKKPQLRKRHGGKARK